VPTAHRILVADDDPIALRFVVTLLRRDGFEVLDAPDGQRAIEVARKHRPDLIVADLLMPYRDGYEVMRAVRQDAALRGTPVIIVSMRCREDDIVRGFTEGADDWIVKPFRSKELLARVRRRLERRGATS
jgi:two-component system alkaline phosphatase synthesis response regulator PhoP